MPIRHLPRGTAARAASFEVKRDVALEATRIQLSGGPDDCR